MQPDFRERLEQLINSYSMENGSNTPDFILAQYLVDCLSIFDRAVVSREQWYGREQKLYATLAEASAAAAGDGGSSV